MVPLKTKNHTDSNHHSHCKTPKLSAFLLIDYNVLKNNKWDIITLNLLLLSFVIACKWKKSKNIEACSCSGLNKDRAASSFTRKELHMDPKPRLWVCSQHGKDEDKSLYRRNQRLNSDKSNYYSKLSQKKNGRALKVWCHHS